MKKRYLIGGLLLLLFIVILVPGAITTKAATPVEKWGQLRVSGTNIVNSSGRKCS